MADVPPPSMIVRCEDPECSVAWAYPNAEHWHPRPHGPDWSVFGLVDDT